MQLSTDTLLIDVNKLRLQIQDMGLEPLDDEEEEFVKRLLVSTLSIEEVITELRSNRDLSASLQDHLSN